jgi:hypothetical protein
MTSHLDLMTTKNKMTYDDGNPGPNVAGFNRLMGFKPSLIIMFQTVCSDMY